MAWRTHRTLALAATLAAATVTLPASDAAADPKTRERAIRVGAIGAAVLLYTASETVAKDAISPDHCRWCSSNALDAHARSFVVWDDTDQARRLSNLIGYVGSPIATTALYLVVSWDAPHRWAAFGDDLTAMFEAVWATQIVTQLVKITAARERPYAHYRPQDPMPITSQEDNLSFISGHSSLTFSIAVGTGLIAQRRGYRLAPVIWASSLAIAATTAYLRMAADRHYLTDVLAGASSGALGGALIPRLTGSFPERMAVVPQPGGLALVGQF